MSDFAAKLTLSRGKTLELHGPADITRETTEAIVNAANSSLLGGGGVDGAIHRAGGPSILQECRRIAAGMKTGTLPAGKAVLTTAGRLPARYVVHTVGPVYRGGRLNEAETLASCYRESLRVADDHGIRSMAFPSISTGDFGYLHQRSFMRKKLIAANWKMYKTPDQTRTFFHDFLPLVQGHDRDEIVVCPTYLCLDAAITAARGSNIAIGAQDLYWEKEGAFTGEINAAMLAAIGVTHVIIGHSERRQYFGETDDTVNLKLKSALESGLVPIVCVGEALEEREANLTDDVLRRQCLRAFNKVSAKKAAKLVVAYEPIWAIGTGKTATPQLAADAHAIIRA